MENKENNCCENKENSHCGHCFFKKKSYMCKIILLVILLVISFCLGYMYSSKKEYDHSGNNKYMYDRDIMDSDYYRKVKTGNTNTIIPPAGTNTNLN